MDQALLLLRLLYEYADTGWLGIWTLADKLTHWFPVSELEAAAAYAIESSAAGDVYFCVGLRGQKFGPHQRGESRDVIAIPCFHADIDVRGPAHASDRLPPTIEAAVALVREFPLSPTAVVHSGHGIQAYWAFREPWRFDSDEERQDAQSMARRFHETLQQLAARHGWVLDNVSDLARVLRVPGTTNHKRELVPVTVLEVNDATL